ncbi:unnamed protein product, partial [Hydatigera taeniaeformis]|uniref:Utp21 domain-containing protein n=1 Tax=Hydatigena taeniaeformis TaxID=6205 RepID=A0A0R3WN45_HYDTA
MSRLRRLTPSALDIEMRLLAPSRDALVEALAAIDYSNGGGVSLSFNPYARLSAFLSLLLNRFRRNLDFDLATACLEGLLRYHGELIARPPKAPTSIPTKPFSADQDDSGDAGSFCLGDMVAAETGCRNDHLDADRPLELMEAVLEAKR